MPEVSPSKFVVMAGWDDAPHLTEEQKRELEAGIPPYQRDARKRGIPQLGAGAIYPIPEEAVVVDDFRFPAYFGRGYGLDVGWNKTAAVWGGHDPENDVIYLYSEYYRGQAEPVVHAEAIKARGIWMKGAIDPAAGASSQKDGSRLMDEYAALGLNLVRAENVVEAGLLEVYQRLSSGRLKVFRSLANWLAEYRLYRRDEKGKVVKEMDHLMDCTRYLCMTPGVFEVAPRDVRDGRPKVANMKYEVLS